MCRLPEVFAFALRWLSSTAAFIGGFLNRIGAFNWSLNIDKILVLVNFVQKRLQILFRDGFTKQHHWMVRLMNAEAARAEVDTADDAVVPRSFDLGGLAVRAGLLVDHFVLSLLFDQGAL